MDIFNAIGVVGGVLYMLSYALLNTGKIIGNGFIYIGLNLAGALCMATSLYVHWNAPSFVVQLCWIIISLVGIARRLRERRCHAKSLLTSDVVRPHLNA